MLGGCQPAVVGHAAWLQYNTDIPPSYTPVYLHTDLHTYIHRRAVGFETHRRKEESRLTRMPSGYTAQQKAAISQFVSFASTDQKTAVKVGHMERDTERGEKRKGRRGEE